MKLPRVVWVIVYALLALAVLYAGSRVYDRLFGPNAEIAALQAALDQAVADAEAQRVEAMSTIAAKVAEISERDIRIAGLVRESAQYVEQISTYQAELTALQNAEPSQPELESEPLVINLRAQVTVLTASFSLAQETIASQAAQLDEWRGKFDAQASISDEWRQMYEREHALRLASEDIAGRLRDQGRVDRLIRKVTTAGLIGAGAYILVKSIA